MRVEFVTLGQFDPRETLRKIARLSRWFTRIEASGPAMSVTLQHGEISGTAVLAGIRVPRHEEALAVFNELQPRLKKLTHSCGGIEIDIVLRPRIRDVLVEAWFRAPIHRVEDLIKKLEDVHAKIWEELEAYRMKKVNRLAPSG